MNTTVEKNHIHSKIVFNYILWDHYSFVLHNDGNSATSWQRGELPPSPTPKMLFSKYKKTQKYAWLPKIVA
jgi:hypothetical protein